MDRGRQHILPGQFCQMAAWSAQAYAAQGYSTDLRMYRNKFTLAHRSWIILLNYVVVYHDRISCGLPTDYMRFCSKCGVR